MFRIALIITALLSGHHHVTITHPDGRGYMTTAIHCTPKAGGSITGQPTKIRCIHGHIVVKSRFAHVAIRVRSLRNKLHVRRAYVFNAEGRLSGWVDWRRSAHPAATPGSGFLIGRYILHEGPEVWLEQ